MWDVVIVGAGPSGATAAIKLSLNGHKVLLLDKESFPREKICGDALIADSQRCLDRQGLLSEVERNGKTISRLSYYSPSGYRVDVKSKMIMIKRLHLDDILVKEAIRMGAVLEKANVIRIEQDTDCVSVETSEPGCSVKARICILATGAHITLGKKLDLINDTRSNAVAVRCYVKSPVVLDRLVFSYDKNIMPAYGWIFPLSGGEFNIGCGVFNGHNLKRKFNLRDYFKRFVGTFPLAKEIFDKATETTSLAGMPLRCGFMGTKKPRTGRVLSVGEAIGTTFPFSGEGIGKAMESAEIAANVISKSLTHKDEDMLSGYDQILKTQLEPKYEGYRKAEKWLAKVWLNDFLARRAQNSEFVKECMTELLEERADVNSFFYLSSVLKSFWR